MEHAPTAALVKVFWVFKSPHYSVSFVFCCEISLSLKIVWLENPRRSVLMFYDQVDSAFSRSPAKVQRATHTPSSPSFHHHYLHHPSAPVAFKTPHDVRDKVLGTLLEFFRHSKRVTIISTPPVACFSRRLPPPASPPLKRAAVEANAIVHHFQVLVHALGGLEAAVVGAGCLLASTRQAIEVLGWLLLGSWWARGLGEEVVGAREGGCTYYHRALAASVLRWLFGLGGG